MGSFIKINGKLRELVKVKSNAPGHNGYFTTYREDMLPGQEEYFEPQIGERPDDSAPGIQIAPGDPPAESIKHHRKKVKR